MTISQHDFNSSDYIMFSMGEATARFASGGGVTAVKGGVSARGGKQYVVRPHLRKLGMASKSAARSAWRAGAGTARLAWDTGAGVARAGWNRGSALAGKGVDVIKRNPKASAIVAAGAGTAYILGRRKNRRDR